MAWSSSSSNARIYWCDDIIQQLIVKKEKGGERGGFLWHRHQVLESLMTPLWQGNWTQGAATPAKKCNPLFYAAPATLWRFDMHDILLDCQLLLLWFWSHQQLQLITILHEITRYEKFRNDSFFSYLSLFLLMTTPNSFSRWHRANLWLVKTLSKLSMFLLRVLFSIP